LLIVESLFFLVVIQEETIWQTGKAIPSTGPEWAADSVPFVLQR
jgi:hypothetical protein